MQHASFRLVEECSGVGELVEARTPVRYRLARYQGMLEGSGMPIPGLQRLEGAIDPADERLVGSDLTLRLEDGRTVAVTLTSADGRILKVGHGPGRGCSCC